MENIIANLGARFGRYVFQCAQTTCRPHLPQIIKASLLAYKLAYRPRSLLRGAVVSVTASAVQKVTKTLMINALAKAILGGYIESLRKRIDTFLKKRVVHPLSNNLPKEVSWLKNYITDHMAKVLNPLSSNERLGGLIALGLSVTLLTRAQGKGPSEGLKLTYEAIQFGIFKKIAFSYYNNAGELALGGFLSQIGFPFLLL